MSRLDQDIHNLEKEIKLMESNIQNEYDDMDKQIQDVQNNTQFEGAQQLQVKDGQRKLEYKSSSFVKQQEKLLKELHDIDNFKTEDLANPDDSNDEKVMKDENEKSGIKDIEDI